MCCVLLECLVCPGGFCTIAWEYITLALYCQVRTPKLNIILDCLIVFLLGKKGRNYKPPSKGSAAP